LSKWWVLDSLTTGGRVGETAPSRIVSVIPPILRFRFARNSGAAFSILEEHPEVLAIIAGVMSVALLVWALVLLKPHERLARVSLALVFGGAVGNLLDRVRHDLFVVDFIEIHWRGRPVWPTFNIADSAISVGICLFFVASLLVVRHERKQAPPPATGKKKAS